MIGYDILTRKGTSQKSSYRPSLLGKAVKTNERQAAAADSTFGLPMKASVWIIYHTAKLAKSTSMSVIRRTNRWKESEACKGFKPACACY